MPPSQIRDWFARVYDLRDQPNTSRPMRMDDQAGQTLGYMKEIDFTHSAYVYNAKKRVIGKLVSDFVTNYCYVFNPKGALVRIWARDRLDGLPSKVLISGWPYFEPPHDYIFSYVTGALEDPTEEELQTW